MDLRLRKSKDIVKPNNADSIIKTYKKESDFLSRNAVYLFCFVCFCSAGEWTQGLHMQISTLPPTYLPSIFLLFIWRMGLIRLPRQALFRLAIFLPTSWVTSVTALCHQSGFVFTLGGRGGDRAASASAPPTNSLLSWDSSSLPGCLSQHHRKRTRIRQSPVTVRSGIPDSSCHAEGLQIIAIVR